MSGDQLKVEKVNINSASRYARYISLTVVQEEKVIFLHQGLRFIKSTFRISSFPYLMLLLKDVNMGKCKRQAASNS